MCLCVSLFAKATFKLSPFRISRRFLSRAQVSTALRPFYFLVHPDLFGKFPIEQSVNETSYKLLSAYLNVMIDDKQLPRPIEATFYIKSRAIKRAASLRQVRVSLKNIARVRDAVTVILKCAELPTSYVDSLPDLGERENITYESIGDDAPFAEPAVDDVPKGRGMHSTDVHRPLPRWLHDNVETARARLAKSEPIRYEVERLQDELCNRLDLEDISWDCSWNLLHRRGALESFDNMAQHYYETVRPILQNRNLVFGQTSGVSLSGKVVLFSGEVRHNWLNTIKEVPKEDALFSRIPLVEKALSQQLRDVQIVQRDDHLVTLVHDYREQLKHLITNVSDYLTRQNFPQSWPESLSEHQLCVETEASPLMLSPSGQFIVPASCPGFLLVRFITENLAESKRLMSTIESRNLQENTLVIRCINDLGLIQLDKDVSLSSEAMVQCCQRLLEVAPVVRHMTHGNHLVVTRYFSVMSDGIICIPWNFKI